MYPKHQICFIFILCAFSRVNYAIAKEPVAGEAGPFLDTERRGKCTAESCTCAQIPKWTGVDCEHVTESPFPTLDFRRFKYLPERIFLGLRIYVVFLWDPDITVSENVFDGILGLDGFLVAQSSIKVLPDLRIVKNSIQLVAIRSSHLISLEGKHLQNLPYVWFLSFYDNYIQYIDPDVFEGTDYVQYLDLSHNRLAYIPEKLFNPMKRLLRLNAEHNNLLYVNNLFSVTRPMGFQLAFNNITNFSLPQNPKNFAYKFYIDELDLSYNFIKETSLTLSTCYKGATLEIANLTLNGNVIVNLYDCLRCLKLKKLEIIGNQIQLLTEKDFMSVFGTQKLLLRGNQIRGIDTDTFKPFNTSLLELDLSSNKIISINGSVKYLSNLRMLNLSYNSIEAFSEDELLGLDLFQYLYLQHNKIKTLGKLQKLKSLRALNIAQNIIKLIKPDQLPNTLQRIYLAGNPFKCDCNLKLFLIFLKVRQEQNNFKVDIDICVRPVTGGSLRKQSDCPSMCSCRCTEYSDDISMFIDCSSRNLYSIPNFLSNNLPRIEDNGTISSFHQHHLLIQEDIRSTFNLEDRLIGISLENNNLELLDAAQLPPNLTQLYLSNNRLKWLPDSIFNNQLSLKEVTLSGNPWICNCDTIKFKKWLIYNRNIIQDFDNIRCGITDKGEGKLDMSVIWKLPDSDLCPPTDFVLIFSLILGCLSFLIICSCAKTFYAKYKLNAKLFLYSHGFTTVKDEYIDYDKAFDAFISFSHEDDEFVIREVISEIEERIPNIRLCLPYRHFIAGVLIHNNIIYAVKNSKMTVLILSRHFLNSDWCLLEFRTAYRQKLEDKLHRIIVIKVGDLPQEMDPTIEDYLKRTTYLTWGETDFWKKFLFVLPSPPSDRKEVPRNAGDNDIVFNCSFSEL